jgi:hypothetical protein
VGIDLGNLDADLRVVGRGVEQHLIEKLTASVAGVLLPLGLALLATVGGATAPMSLVAVGSLGLGAAGFVLPDALLRSQAAERRRDFRYALSSYLDLVNVILAAGAGVETALSDAADAGHGSGKAVQDFGKIIKKAVLALHFIKLRHGPVRARKNYCPICTYCGTEKNVLIRTSSENNEKNTKKKVAPPESEAIEDTSLVLSQ